jgi:3-phenylpropionate/trans-cinnamate dioxygenase ferredoxin reductase subunit
METFEVVVAGGGLAAARAVKAYREAGGEGRVALLAGEDTLPYHRPPLSKRFLRGETDDTPHVENEAFYREHEVEVRLGTRVERVDPATRTISAGGTELGYRKLLLATPPRFARRLDARGVRSSSAPASSAWRSPRRSGSSTST